MDELNREHCYRLWRYALMQYCRDCHLTLKVIRTKGRLPDDEAAAAWRDLEAGGQQLAWLCECASLDFEYTRQHLTAWLADAATTTTKPARAAHSATTAGASR